MAKQATTETADVDTSAATEQAPPALTAEARTAITSIVGHAGMFGETADTAGVKLVTDLLGHWTALAADIQAEHKRDLRIVRKADGADAKLGATKFHARLEQRAELAGLKLSLTASEVAKLMAYKHDAKALGAYRSHLMLSVAAGEGVKVATWPGYLGFETRFAAKEYDALGQLTAKGQEADDAAELKRFKADTRSTLPGRDFRTECPEGASDLQVLEHIMMVEQEAKRQRILISKQLGVVLGADSAKTEIAKLKTKVGKLGQ